MNIQHPTFNGRQEYIVLLSLHCFLFFSLEVGRSILGVHILKSIICKKAIGRRDSQRKQEI